jgi:hypothetical protein
LNPCFHWLSCLERDTKTSTKSSTKTKILGWVQPHKAPYKPEEVPPKLQEAIDEMNERKAKKLEEMEKNGQKPNSKLSHPVIFDGAGILNGLAAGLS